MSTEGEKNVPSILDAAKDLAKAIIEIDIATATDDPYLQNEIRFIKDGILKMYLDLCGEPSGPLP